MTENRNNWTWERETIDEDLEELAAAIVDGPGDGWGDPVLFDDAVTVDFPTECLPKVLEGEVEAVSLSTQTPEEMSATMALGVLATAFQSRYIVEVKPDWKEPLSLYCAAIAPPGERKSAVINALTRPIYEYEAEKHAADADKIARSRAEQKMLEERLAFLQSKASKGKSESAREEAHDEALRVAEELAHFQNVYETRFLLDDSTPEKLIVEMEKQGGSITVCSAEGDIFDAMDGRYDNRGGLGLYLKGHAGDPIVVDRLGRRSNRINNPHLTMILTVQPDVLAGLMSNKTFRGRGLCGRFLYAICRSKVGRRQTITPPVPEDVKNDYNQFVRHILAGTGTGVLKLSPGAESTCILYQQAVEARLGNEWENMRDWGGKVAGAAVRIAGLLHCAQAVGEPSETPISTAEMDAGVKIAEYYARNAEAAYQLMGGDQDVDSAKYLLRRFADYAGEYVSRGELQRMCRGKFTRSADMDAGLEILEEHGYIRTIHEPPQDAGGRPRTLYEVNPRIKE